MITIKIPIKKTEQVKKFLIQNNILDQDYRFNKDNKFMYLPTKNYTKTKQKFKFIKKSNKKLQKKSNKPTTLKQALERKLTKKQLSHLKTAHDTIGNIAILEIDKELVKKQKLIAQTLLKINKNIKTVLKKSGEHTGVFRTQKLKYLAGIKTKIATYKENNVILKLDVEKVYFSVRLATERKRIMKQIKKNEEVLVMFSGCGPYPLTIAKNTQAKHITAIEINPTAHKYALENIKLNKINNITALKGDVKKQMPKLKTKFDRILMPLPKSAEDFLYLALKAIKPKGIIHFYDFLNDKDIPKAAIQKIKKACTKEKKKYKIIRHNKCGQFSPHTYRICVDFKVLN
tara:strand:- start:1968 stop:2999 length:1032 start_codon:yes stop_codon:yes gene_type:complete